MRIKFSTRKASVDACVYNQSSHVRKKAWLFSFQSAISEMHGFNIPKLDHSNEIQWPMSSVIRLFMLYIKGVSRVDKRPQYRFLLCTSYRRE